MQLIYVASAIGSAFDSQVMDLLVEMTNKKFQKIHLFVGTNEKKMTVAEKKIFDIGASYGIDVIFYKNFGMYPLLDILNILELRKKISNLNIDEQTIIHARGEYSAYIVYEAVKKNGYLPNVIVDVRGAVKEELQLYSRMRLLKKFVKIQYLTYISRIILRNSSGITAVSKTLEEYLKQKHIGSMDGKEISIIPSLAGSNFYFDKSLRQEYRNKLGFSDKDIIVVFSSGAENAWQNEQKIIKMLDNIDNVKLLMLSKKKYNHDKIVSMFVPYSEVSKYLNAADVGIIFREENIVNAVASPIKFSEYISCGLPIIADKGVVLISDYINENQCGHIVNDSNSESITSDVFEKLCKMDKKIIGEKGVVDFGVKNIAEMYFSLYKKILKKGGGK